MAELIGVFAGKYEDDNGELYENCKFCDSYYSLLEALSAIKEKKLTSYPFCYVERNGARFEAVELLKQVEALC